MESFSFIEQVKMSNLEELYETEIWDEESRKKRLKPTNKRHRMSSQKKRVLNPSILNEM